MPKVLVVTVGGSPQPIITAIKSLNPDRVVFLCSGKTKEQVIGEGKPCKIWRNKEIVDELPNFPTYLQLEDRFRPDQDLVIIDDPEDSLECYEAASKTLYLLLQEYEKQEINVDHTGGTKTMSMALGMAAMDYGVDLYFTSGFRGSLIDLPQGETTHPVSSAYINILTRLEQFLPDCLRHYNHSLAVAQLNNLAQLQLSSDDKQHVRRL